MSLHKSSFLLLLWLYPRMLECNAWCNLTETTCRVLFFLVNYSILPENTIRLAQFSHCPEPVCPAPLYHTHLTDL